MKKIIAITQRVERFNKYDELRDCLDQSWSAVANKLNYELLPLPNNSKPKEIFSAFNLSGIILSGGNSISIDENNDKEDISIQRDNFERELIRLAITQQIPLLGVCRGMQLINIYFGGSIVKINGHVNVTHDIKINLKNKYNNLIESVNSYHNWGITTQSLSSELLPFATATDGTIEGFVHRNHKMGGIMWHPERGDFDVITQEIIKNLLDD